MNKTTINYKKIVDQKLKNVYKTYAYDKRFLQAQKDFATILDNTQKIGEFVCNAQQLASVNLVASLVFSDEINNKWQALSNNKQKEILNIAINRATKSGLFVDRSTLKNDVREYEYQTRVALNDTMKQIAMILATDNGKTTIKIKNQSI